MINIASLCPEPWSEYALIDSGHFEKLERFGTYILRRPEPQAIWSPSLPESEWKAMAHAVFDKSRSNPESGNWNCKPGMPERWYSGFFQKDIHVRFKLALSSFKHVGIFPEQAVNWLYLFDSIRHLQTGSEKPVKVLNLFAYTGIASLVARQTGAEVTHLDAVKPVVSWARENMEASGLEGMRWMVDDALKFVQREVRRQSQYQVLILDPPAYGRGPDGEKWILEEKLPELLDACSKILDPERQSLILNLYSLGFSSSIASNLMKEYFPQVRAETGELHLEDGFGKILPLGVFARFCEKGRQPS
jgi:23S rRNA (cytosine1962-C5)-methyltransferase